MINTKLENMNLLDKFLFDEAMEDKETYQTVVRILLENEVELLEKTETEKELRVSPQLRQVRLDVIGMDREGTIYYTEMQQRNTGNLLRRSRYYQAQLDVSLLEPGSTDYNLLNESCFILIAPFDIFGRGLYRYTFEGRCRECPDLKLEDGATKVFINTKGTNRSDFSKEFLDFMEYIGKTTDETAENSGSEKIRGIHETVKQIRKSEKAGVRLMQRWEELAYAREEGREEGKKEGKEEGKEEGKKEGCLKHLIEGVCKKLMKEKTATVIADELEEELETVETVVKFQRKLGTYDVEQIYEAIQAEQNGFLKSAEQLS